MRYILLFIVCSMVTLSGYAFTLRPDAPARYEVQSGDTLWGIANRYLTSPWEWKELWHANPQIKNPNQLYAGAIIELQYDGKKPYLRVLSNGTVKLSPHVRPTPMGSPIPAIPLSDIKPFLSGSLIIDRDRLDDAPFIIAFTAEHMLAGQGDDVYVKDLCPATYKLRPGVTLTYAIYRPCGKYHDPITKRFLGYKAALVAYAELIRGGDPATITITEIKQGVRLRDRVMPDNYPDFDLSFLPKAPARPIRGEIIDILGDYTQGAFGLVVVIDRGKDVGIQNGDVLAVYNNPKLVRNSAYRNDKKPPCEPECVRLPPERMGEVMVFRTFTHTSLALVVRSIRAIKRFNKVTNP